MPAVRVPPFPDRALLEQLLRRMHLVRLRTSAKNRVFGLLSQWGVRIQLKRLRKPDGLALLERHGVPKVWGESVREALAVIDYLDERVAQLDQLLRPLAREDERASADDLEMGRESRPASLPGRRFDHSRPLSLSLVVVGVASST